MDLEQTAIERLKMASDMSLRLYKQPLVITYSGGKDSDVLLHLAGRSGIPYEVLHSLTTADAPETVWHVRDTFRRLELAGVKCDIDTHKRPDGMNVTMWNLIPRKLMPPTRLVRYCCAELKEGGGKGRWIATGVRWAESQKRKSRGVMEAMHLLWLCRTQRLRDVPGLQGNLAGLRGQQMRYGMDVGGTGNGCC